MQRLTIRNRMVAVILGCSFVAALVAIATRGASPQPLPTDVKTEPHRMAPPSAGYISGVVTSAK